MMHYILEKGHGHQLSPHLNQREIDCKCDYKDCNFTIINQLVIDAFELLRMNCGDKPLFITSAFRCQRHNQKEHGVPNSMHMRGLALDILQPEHMDDMEFINMAAHSGFTYVLPYNEPDRIHAQIKLIELPEYQEKLEIRSQELASK